MIILLLNFFHLGHNNIILTKNKNIILKISNQISNFAMINLINS